ncbi:DUF4102 domain-containing protein [Iningainema tapete]|uniref:DUF4102 domain-containing protein n=1 Tax=Iningainema tapete BLCC-T55 TaxID=2748662 RepID=A0A8J6XG35_9CYAN|nr:DUF4102 domain-containing protein [Iningainema tapete]MBD2775179.1 DUF4102 domain-containing protein [Iningainema tapete BLCC-T55]
MKEHEQLELPLNIAPTKPSNPYVPILDPYWDEILRESSQSEDCDNFDECNLYGTASQHDDFVGEQLSFLSAPQQTLTQSQYQSVGEQVTENATTDLVDSLVGEQVKQDTKKSAPQHDTAHWVEKYWVQRGGNKYWYYRYMWMQGRKLNRIYIGSVRSRAAQTKKEAVEIAIASGLSPCEIKQLLLSNHEPKTTMP